MKPKSTLRSFLAVAGSSLLATSSLQAATLTWDHNADGTASDGGGTWLNANQWLDGVTPATWNNGTPDNAIIGSGGTGGTITLGAVSAGTVLIEQLHRHLHAQRHVPRSDRRHHGGFDRGGRHDQPHHQRRRRPDHGRHGQADPLECQQQLQRSVEHPERRAVQITASINNNGANGVLGNSALPVILGASGQTGRLSIQNDGGVSTNKEFTLATGGTGVIQFGNIGTFQITNADRPLTLSGAIGGSGNFVKLGGAAVVLSGNNNYSGTTTVNEGSLRLNHATAALPGGIAETGGTSALTINGNGTINVGATIGLTSTSGDFKRGLGTGIAQFQIPGGISGFDAFGSARQVIVNNDPAFELQWGIPTFNPSELLLGYHPQT